MGQWLEEPVAVSSGCSSGSAAKSGDMPPRKPILTRPEVSPGWDPILAGLLVVLAPSAWAGGA